MSYILKNVLRKHRAIIFILSTYFQMVYQFINFCQNHDAPNRLESRDNLWSKIECLNDDLSNVQISIQKLLNINLPDKKRSRLEKYSKNLYRISKTLGESAHFEIKRLVQTLLAINSAVCSNMTCFTFACEKIKFFNECEYKVWEIIYETVYVFQKFVWLIYKPFSTENLVKVYLEMNEDRIKNFQINIVTLASFDDQTKLVEFIHYTKISLKFLQNYLDRMEKTVLESENMSEKTKELLSTICNYIPIYISILSEALDAEKTLEIMAPIMKDFADRLYAVTEKVIIIVESRSDDENETNKLVYYAFLFFQEIVQNMESILEIRNREFRSSLQNA